MFFIDIVTYMDIGLSKSFGLFCSYTDKLQSWKWKKKKNPPHPPKKTPKLQCMFVMFFTLSGRKNFDLFLEKNMTRIIDFSMRIPFVNHILDLNIFYRKLKLIFKWG